MNTRKYGRTYHYPFSPGTTSDDRRKYKLRADDKSATGWVAQQAKEQARVYLRAKQAFVWNATNITKQLRSQLISLFTDYGARVKIVYVEQPYNSWQAQNRNREAYVPGNILNRLLQKLEVPLITEAHEVVYEVKEKGRC